MTEWKDWFDSYVNTAIDGPIMNTDIEGMYQAFKQRFIEERKKRPELPKKYKCGKVFIRESSLPSYMKAYEMRQRGFSVNWIAQELGIKRQAVDQKLRRYEIYLKQQESA
jgi:hypothetical protein